MVDNQADYFNPSIYTSVTKEDYNPKVPPKDPSFFKTLESSFRLNNEFVSELAQTEGLREALDPNKKFSSEVNYLNVAKENGYSGQQLEAFSFVDSEKQYNAVVSQIEREEFDREVQANAGLGYNLMADLVSGSTNPSTMVLGLLAGPAAFAGKSYLQTAGKVAALNAFDTAVIEVGLHQSQLTRTGEESQYAVGAATLLGGVLGGVGKKAALAVEAKRARKLTEAVDEIRNNALDLGKDAPETATDLVGLVGGGNISAARVGELSDAELTLAYLDKPIIKALLGNKAARTLVPFLDTMQMQSRKVREATLRLVSSPLATEGTEAGLGKVIPAEAYKGRFLRYEAEIRDAGHTGYKQYVRANAENGTPKVSQDKFFEEIGRAMHLGDDLTQTSLPTSAYEHAAKAMKTMRERQVKLQDELVANGLLPANVKPGNAQSYMFVQWEYDKILQNEELWNKKVISHFEKEFHNIREQLKKDGTPESSKLLDTTFRNDDLVAKDFAEARAFEITEKIKGLGRSQSAFIEYDVDALRGPLKKRGFNIDIDRDMTQFMNTNAVEGLTRMGKYGHGRLSIDRTFGKKKTGRTLVDADGNEIEELANYTFEDLSAEISSEYNTLRQAIRDNEKLVEKSKLKKLKELRDEEARAKATLQSWWELNLGTFKSSSLDPDGFWRRASMSIRNFNFLRYMGGRVISSMSDVGMPIFVHGFSNIYGNTLKPLTRALANPEMRKALASVKDEMGDFGLALEHILNARNEELFNLGDPFARRTGFERLLENSTSIMSKYSGANAWDNMMQSAAHLAAHQRLLRVASSKTIKPKDAAFFARFGLGVDDIKAIGKNFAEHGADLDGVRIANTKDWADKALAEKMEAALFQVNRSTLLSKGFADAPIFSNKEAGKLILQFMGHVFASNHRILAVATQLGAKDGAIAQGMATMISMGILVQVIKDLEKDPRNLPDYQIEDLVMAGIDRSGVASVPMYIRGMAQTAGIDPLAFAGVTAPSKYAEWGSASQYAGAWLGTLDDAIEASRGVSKIVSPGQDASASDIKNMTSRIVPFATMPVIKTMLKEYERAIDREYGKRK